jgi:hypothetical protein
VPPSSCHPFPCQVSPLEPERFHIKPHKNESVFTPTFVFFSTQAHPTDIFDTDDNAETPHLPRLLPTHPTPSPARATFISCTSTLVHA